jgi:hypothetical protein
MQLMLLQLIKAYEDQMNLTELALGTLYQEDFRKFHQEDLLVSIEVMVDSIQSPKLQLPILGISQDL